MTGAEFHWDKTERFPEGLVNPFLAVAGLILFVGVMFMLPLLPALVELKRKSDALPLNVVQQNAGEIRHFASSFRTYIQALEPILQRCVASGETASGTLPDGVEYLALDRCEDPQALPIRATGRHLPGDDCRGLRHCCAA